MPIARCFHACAVVLVASLVGVAAAADPADLAGTFRTPTAQFRPWLYSLWMNGNVTKEGLTADLEAMARVGIGGALIFNVGTRVPAGAVVFASPEWHELFKHACAEANRLGLEINVNNDAGWCGSGGPWITPDLAMQKVVWSETPLRGPRKFDEVLEQPAKRVGYYEDIAVLAFPTPPYDFTRIPDIDFKATFVVRSALPTFPPMPNAFPTLPSEVVVASNRILDLSDRVKDGRLTWDVPEGDWTVLRLGHTTTGKTNHPAAAGGTGLECDKLSAAAMDVHFAALMDKLVAEVGPLAGKTLVSTHIDSWEVQGQNWTPQFREEFHKRRGYDLLRFLPAITGRVVDGVEISERFLWDWRQTISDLMLDNYAGRLRNLANRRGLRLSIEAYDGTFGDDMAYAGRADEPMGEFWYGRDPGNPGEGRKDPEGKEYLFRSWSWCANMTSAAHTYGKRIVGAEAFTSMDWLHAKGRTHPAQLKRLADWALCEGVNRFVFHCAPMQPWLDRKPGMAFDFWGTPFVRTQTWWEQSLAWNQYLARCQFLLRQGLFVADVCYLQPEGAPMRFEPPGEPRSPEPPNRPGYNYDGCTPEVVLTRMSVRNGQLVLPDGTSYRMLVLPDVGLMPYARTMTPGLLKRIAELAEAGATIVGPPPLRSPSLEDYPQCDGQIDRLVKHLWADCDGKTATEHRVGNGRVIWGKTPQEVLAGMGVPPDFVGGSVTSPPVRYCHRRLEDGTDIYFVANKERDAREITCGFRVADKRPEFWWPQTGRIEPAAVYDKVEGTSNVALRLEEDESVFVVFRPEARPQPNRITAIVRDGTTIVDTSRGRVRTTTTPQSGAPPVAPFDPTQLIEIVGEGPARKARIWRKGDYTLKMADGNIRQLAVERDPRALDVSGPWELSFPPHWGAPEKVTLDRLISWSDHANPGVRYFSGTATYRKTLVVPPEMVAADRCLTLDLGTVEIMAEVAINGKPLGILWKPPYRVEITDAVKAGDNSLEVRVVNLWVNRLIGDEQLPDDGQWEPLKERYAVGRAIKEWPAWLLEGKPSPTGRLCFTNSKYWDKDSPLQPSGLLGPVRLRAAVIRPCP